MRRVGVVELPLLRVHEGIAREGLAVVEGGLADLELTGLGRLGGMSFTTKVGRPSGVTVFEGEPTIP